MPKLSSSMADKVDEVESSTFEAIPEGIYRAVLEGEVEVVQGAKGPYWKWVFKIVEEGEGKGRKMFVNTSLSESALWKLKEVFDAFGEPTSTDTDDLIGREVKLFVVQKPYEQGARAGEMGNEVKNVLPVNQATADAAKAKKSGGNTPSADEPALF